MDHLITQMSYLFTKQRFNELQGVAREICYTYSGSDPSFRMVMDEIEDFIEKTPVYRREYEQVILHYMVMRGLALYLNGEKITEVQWAHAGWMGTAEKGDIIQ